MSKYNFQWVVNSNIVGEYNFTLDGKTIYSLWQDYPYNLTKEEKEYFDKVNPYWVDFFKDRNYE